MEKGDNQPTRRTSENQTKAFIRKFAWSNRKAGKTQLIYDHRFGTLGQDKKNNEKLSN